MRIAAALLALIATTAPMIRAGAQPDAAPDALARARALEAQLAYDEALAIVQAEIAAGRADRDRLIELHLIAGRLSAGLDRAQPAEDHFAIVLALDPARTLPEGTSPKIGVPFTVARTRSAPLEVRVTAAAGEVAVEPVTDPLRLVTGIAVRLRDADRETTRAARTTLHLAHPADTTILEVRALDRYGNVVWTGAPPPVELPPPPPPHDEPSWLGRWTTWAAATGVALAAGGVAAWRFRVAQDEFDDKRAAGMTDFTELQAIEDRGERWGLAANLGFGVAAATGVAAIVLFVRRPANPSDVTVTVGPGAGLGLAGRF